MTRFFFVVAVLASFCLGAQKREINTALKAVESGDLAVTGSKLTELESSMGGKMSSLDPNLLEQYYYTKGLYLYKKGKKKEGAAYLSKIGDLAKTKIFVGKHGKNKVYFYGKEAAKRSGIPGLKESKFRPEFIEKSKEVLNPYIQELNKTAMEDYNKKNYASAAPKFEEIYHLLSALGQEDKIYLYYSAVTYALAGNKPLAIKAYDTLIDSGYTGVETKYFAKNKKSGEKTSFDKTTWELYKKMGDTGEYTDFTSEDSKSVEEELYETGAALHIESDEYDRAIALAEEGIKKFPKNAKLVEYKGVAYYKSGKTEAYVSSLKETVAKDPNNKEAWYNLGVLISKDPAKEQEAIEYFSKAVAIDPKFSNAWQNLVFVTIGEDQKAIDKYNALRKSGKIGEANKILEERRKRFEKALPYAEKWYEADPTNLEAVSMLKGLYVSTKNTAKAAEFKAKEKALVEAQKQ
ncbi:MAG: tetratricopeptide repeat protein [Bergeyella sp.]|nr:tetratricopeptide repeat protein [Bergeyella sp.]